jgi:hypothetical protein
VPFGGTRTCLPMAHDIALPNLSSCYPGQIPLKEPGERDKNAPCGSNDPIEPHLQASMLEARSSDLSGGQSHLISQSFKLSGCPSLSVLAI